MVRADGSPPGLNLLVPLATIILLVATLHYARNVLVPLCLAILLTFILSPVASQLEKAGLRRVQAVAAVSVLFIAVAVTLAWVVGHQVIDVAAQVPKYRENIDRKLESVRSIGDGKLKGFVDSIDGLQQEIFANSPQAGAATENGEKPLPEVSKASRRPIVVQTQPSSPPLVTRILGPVLRPVSETGIVLVLLLFMLVRRESLRNRIFLLAGRGHLTTTTRALEEAGERVSRYLVFQSIINVSFGLLIGIGLHFIGIPNPIFWGALSGLLRYIPYIGPIIAGALPTVLALALFPEWHRALYVLGLYVVIEATTAYFVEPLLYGAKTGITALSVLLAAIFWGLIWGPVGLILSTPLTVCLVAFGKHIPQLEFLTILLGDDIQLSPEVQVYQRLLAGDPEEARGIAKSFLEQTSIAEVYDSLFLPVLILTEQDLHRGALEESRKALIFDGLKDLIEDLSAEADFALQSTLKEKPVEPTALGAMHTRAVLVPARDEGDEIAAIMLAHLLNRSQYKIDTIPPLAQSQMLREISDRGTEIVCISALPPLSIGPARTLYRKVKGQTPKARIVLGMWRLGETLPGLQERLGLSESDKVVTSLAESAYQIHAFCDSLAQGEGGSRTSSSSPREFPQGQVNDTGNSVCGPLLPQIR